LGFLKITQTLAPLGGGCIVAGMKDMWIALIVVVLISAGCGKKKVEKAAQEPEKQSEGTPVQTADTKTCYWCKESINAEALVCKHCGKKPDEPVNIDNPIVEQAIRKELKKPTGELTMVDLEKVTGLSLSFTQITDVGLKEVAKLQELSLLHLSGTQITDAGLKHVANLKKLKILELWHCRITDAALEDLSKLKQLEILSLQNTKVTESGVAKLRKLLPRCDIDHTTKK
jgi:hypothetical protein